MEHRYLMMVKGSSVFNTCRWLFFIGTFCFFSCHNDRRPKDILPKEEMVRILTEVYVDEQKVSRLGLNSDSANQVFDSLRARALKLRSVPDSVFKRSFDFYLARPKEMELIYTTLMDSLQLMEQRLPVRPEKK